MVSQGSVLAAAGAAAVAAVYVVQRFGGVSRVWLGTTALVRGSAWALLQRLRRGTVLDAAGFSALIKQVSACSFEGVL